MEKLSWQSFKFHVENFSFNRCENISIVAYVNLKCLKHYRARTLPSGGVLPMVQSFACNIQNNCGELEDFEDIPSYPGSKLEVLVQHLEPILYNDTVQEFNRAMPKLLLLLNSTAKAVDSKHVQAAIEEGVHFQE